MKLSTREIRILELLCDGYSDKEIAKKLKNSPRTIQTHITRLALKLNARNRTAAVAIYLRKYAIDFT